jgi:hypothetical protein
MDIEALQQLVACFHKKLNLETNKIYLLWI